MTPAPTLTPNASPTALLEPSSSPAATQMAVDPLEEQLRGMSSVIVPEDLFVDPGTGRDMLRIASPEMAKHWYEELLKGLWQANKAYDIAPRYGSNLPSVTVVDKYKSPEALVEACKRGEKIENLYLPKRLVGKDASGQTMRIFNITMYQVNELVDLL